MASALAAEPVTLSCAFDTECFETEGCAESAFAMRIDWDGRTWADVGSDHANPASPARVTTDAESFEMVADRRNDVLAFGRATEAGEWWTLTIFEEAARLSVHMPASDLALYYKGTCRSETS
ncbi:MAG: hypothetical protein AAGA15_05295 [Pseudomonadota bacterium]